MHRVPRGFSPDPTPADPTDPPCGAPSLARTTCSAPTRGSQPIGTGSARGRGCCIRSLRDRCSCRLSRAPASAHPGCTGEVPYDTATDHPPASAVRHHADSRACSHYRERREKRSPPFERPETGLSRFTRTPQLSCVAKRTRRFIDLPYPSSERRGAFIALRRSRVFRTAPLLKNWQPHSSRTPSLHYSKLPNSLRTPTLHLKGGVDYRDAIAVVGLRLSSFTPSVG